MTEANDLEKPGPAAWPGPLDPLVGRSSCDRRSFGLALCSGLVAAVSGAVRSVWTDHIRPLSDRQVNWRALRQEIVRDRLRIQEVYPGEAVTGLKGECLRCDDHRYTLLVRSQVRSCFEIASRIS